MDAAKSIERPPVLLVDNYINYVDDVRKFLRDWGYEAIVAEGNDYTALKKDALEKFQRHRCRIAIVDVRLEDDTIEDAKTSGTHLIPLLKPAPILLVSSFFTIAKAGNAIALGAFRAISKRDGPEALQQALAEASQKLCFCNIDIEWPAAFSQARILSRLLGNADPLVPDDEVACAIQQLYTRSDGQKVVEITLHPLNDPYKTVASPTPFTRSVVLEVRTRIEGNKFWSQREILKLASREHIESEISNYFKYVQEMLQPDRSARIENNSVVLWDIGGIRYTNVATDERVSLRTWYNKSKSIKAVTDALRDLFTKTLSPWYTQRGDATNQSMFACYSSVFPQLEGRLKNFPNQQREVSFINIPRKVKNPVQWINNDDHRRQTFTSYWSELTHGDLHSDNVFVDPSKKTTVIDFERSGPGYFLRDLVELEADIKLRLLQLDPGNLLLVYELENLLLAQVKPDQLPTWQNIAGATEEQQVALNKAFKVIVALRKVGWETTHFTAMGEYYWALLLETLFSVTRDYESLGKAEADFARDRAWLSAGLICEKLETWSKDNR